MQLFRSDALDHQRRRLLGDVMILQPVRFMLMTAVFVIATVVVAIFLYYSTYSQKESVRGFLVPSSGLITVRPSTTGMVEKIYVDQGMTVERGDPLITIRRDVPDADGLGVVEQLDTELAEQGKELRGRINLVKQRSQAKENQLESQIKSARAEITHLRSILDLNREIAAIAMEEVAKLGPAVERGIMPERERRLREQQRLSAESNVLANQQRLIILEGQVNNHKAALLLLSLDHESELSTLRSQLTDLNVRRAEARRGNIYTLNAPVTGTITDVRALLGGLAGPDQTLLSIRGADDPLVAELVIPARVARSAKSGKKVRISYDAFPYLRYGIYDGEIERVSASVYTPGQRIGSLDLQEAAYKATVRLDVQAVSAFGKTSPLQPGMELRANIVLEERRLIEIFFESLMVLYR